MSAHRDRHTPAPGSEADSAGKLSTGVGTPTANGRDERHQAILRVEDLRVHFGAVQAVAGATFEIQRGTITGLIGPNGAGKTTVVSSIAGQIREASGHVLFEGKEILGRGADEISRLGLRRTLPAANLVGRMTVMETLLMGAQPWDGESLHASLIGRRKWHRREAELARKALAVMREFGVGDLADEVAAHLS